MRTPRRSRTAVGVLVACAALTGLVLNRMAPLLECGGSCFVDYFAIHRAQTAHFELPDVRLNTWILGWVQHALFTDPAALFDANAFHPAKNTLSGSEHLIAVALQTLPLRAFGDDPVLLHQGALVLSFVGLALATFALVRVLFGSTWGGLVAGAVAAFMPWRYSELGHLQLLSVQWLPLVWLFTAQALRRDPPRHAAPALGGVLALQMLSSFYLAYIAVFSTAVLALVLWIARRPPLAAGLRFALAAAIPAAITALTALPYLARFSGYRFRDASATDFFTDPWVTLSLLAPPLTLRAPLESIAPLTYHVPLAVCVLAALAAVWWVRGDGSGAADARTTEARTHVVALLLMTAAGIVLMLGRQVEIGGSLWTLPSHWLAQVVPGFSQMRAEFRWGIILGIALPTLAGAGVAAVEAASRRLADPRAGLAMRVGVRGTAIAFVAANVVWFELPARDAWADAPDVLAAHRAVAQLEPGAVVEIPWRIYRINTAMNGSRYMQASALHWQPILNGYSAYVPPTHRFLQQIARGLPTRHATELLNRLAGVRWVIVHPGRLGAGERQRWALGARPDVLRVAVEGPDFLIFEIVDREHAGVWTEALVSETPGPRTLTGLPRAPIPPPERAGTIDVKGPLRMRYELAAGLDEYAAVQFENPAAETWPGLDIHPQGLVRLRFRFYDTDGRLVHEGVSGFDRDLPGRQVTPAVAAVTPPARSGRFRVVYDIVQIWNSEQRDLGFVPVERTVQVTERKRLPGRDS